MISVERNEPLVCTMQADDSLFDGLVSWVFIQRQTDNKTNRQKECDLRPSALIISSSPLSLSLCQTPPRHQQIGSQQVCVLCCVVLCVCVNLCVCVLGGWVASLLPWEPGLVKKGKSFYWFLWQPATQQQNLRCLMHLQQNWGHLKLCVYDYMGKMKVAQIQEDEKWIFTMQESKYVVIMLLQTGFHACTPESITTISTHMVRKQFTASVSLRNMIHLWILWRHWDVILA